ncbi:MAG TPA: response regulator [Polyangiaceae bacterium]|nr:response regulator [Polyangiaceae bacterium]
MSEAGFDYKAFAVLFVDDEEQARKYFRMALEPEFRVLTAASVNEASELLAAKTTPVGIVVTDQRMPERLGTELLADVRRTRPQIVRMLTTAHADIEAAIQAVNSGAIFKYLVKPWDMRELRITLRHAMEYFLLRRERDLLLKEKLCSLQQLLVADRVRSLAVLAESLSAQVRNTMTALLAYLELVRAEFENAMPRAVPDAGRYWQNLQWETEDANRHLLDVVRSITSATLDTHYEFNDRIALSELVQAAWQGAAESTHCDTLDVHVDPALANVSCDGIMLKKMFGNLLNTLRHAEGLAAGGRVQVVASETTQQWGTECVVVRILRPHFDWGKASVSSLFVPVIGNECDSPDLLGAFFIAHHHGGTIALERSHAGGAGFTVTLPFSPERVARPKLDQRAIEKLFDQLPAWEAPESDA